jgi:Ni,Fe-hydrogenase maturation factor
MDATIEHPAPRSGPPHRVRLIVLGAVDRGDDALAPLAVAELSPDVWPLVDVRLGTSLDVLDLSDVPLDGACIVVDAARGLEPGAIAFIPFQRFMGRSASRLPAPRSSHELPLRDLVRLVKVIRGTLPRGGFLVAGGSHFGLGELPSPEVARVVPRLTREIEETVGRLASRRRSSHRRASGPDAAAAPGQAPASTPTASVHA